jgi:rubrerythrin
MAETTKHLRDLLEKIKADAQRALAHLPNDGELRSLGWKCTACGHVKHFTRPVTAALADRCPKCKATEFFRCETTRCVYIIMLFHR